MPLNTLIEVAATLAGLAYIVLLMRERILCWLFGISGSLLSIYLFIDAGLYSEALLYSYYVAAGVWGWLRWQRRDALDHNPVVRFGATRQLPVILVSALAAAALGTLFAATGDAQRPYIDAATTCFSFAATWLQVKKVLESWYYWIVINAVSIWLYQDRALDIYAGLIALYSVLSVAGLVSWQRAWRRQGGAARPD